MTSGQLGPEAPVGKTDLFLGARPAGTPAVEWARQWGTTGNDDGRGVVVDADGNIFVAGDADGQLGDAGLGAEDAVVSKWTADHELEWTSQWGTPWAEDVRAIAMGADGSLFVAGVTWGDLEGTSAGDWDAFLTKLDPDGDVLWSHQWGSDDVDGATAVVVDEIGSAYVTGETRGQIAGANGTGNVFCRKIDADGGHGWTTQWGVTGRGFGLDLVRTSAGSVLVTGFAGGDMGGTGMGGAFVSAVSADLGVVSWTEQFGADSKDAGRAIVLGPAGDFYIAGVTYGKLGPDPHVGGADVFLQKRNSSRVVAWTRQFGSTARDEAHSMARASNGAIYVVGHTQGVLPGQTQQGVIDNLLVRVMD